MATRIEKGVLESYFHTRVGECTVRRLEPLGSGAHGTGFLVELETVMGRRDFVLKSVTPRGLGHEYPSDRAAMHLLALETFGELEGHVKALDVLALHSDGTVKSIGGGEEYFLLMERAEGVSYFQDLEGFARKESLSGEDREKIRMMARYLAGVHSVKKDSRDLYLRKVRDIIGHGECLMGVFDSYPEGILSHEEMAEIEKQCVDWRARLKGRYQRLCRIHGDFHPGNIWFSRAEQKGEKWRLCLLDRSRGPWGEPADDVTALTINYIFLSVRNFDGMGAPYAEAFRMFFHEYIDGTGDAELLEVVAPFYAFRGAVVANPVFYPDVTPSQRERLFTFVRRVLAEERFAPEQVEEYVSS
jgi:aminoglycoside phosphotransferase (APT) family kinase protein